MEGTDAEAESDRLVEVVDRVCDETGLDINRYSRPYLRRRVRSRLRATGCDDFSEYVDLLDGDECRTFVADLWVNVTEFFRNPGVWRLVYDALPEDADVLSAGCSDGREAYSAAVASLEKGVDADIVGVDIDPQAVEKARQAVYGDVKTDGFDEVGFVSDPSNYLRPTDDGVRVADTVADRAGFRNLDITDLSADGFDVVLCRNLLIYVDDEKKKRVVDSLTDSLEAGGYLVLGKTERVPRGYADVFETVDSRLRVYRYVGE